MFTYRNEPTALAPDDVILVTLTQLTRKVDVRRDKDLLRWAPQGEDFWPYFCQLIKTPEDAHGVAMALAAAAGHGIERIEPTTFRVVAAAKKRKK